MQSREDHRWQPRLQATARLQALQRTLASQSNLSQLQVRIRGASRCHNTFTALHSPGWLPSA